VGLESTILDCTGPLPVVLRPGAVGPADVERAAGVAVGTRRSVLRAPGTLPAHYAPAARVLLAADRRQAHALLGPAPASGDAPTAGLLAPPDLATPPGVVRLGAPEGDEAYARGLYRALREADALGLRTVVAVVPNGRGALATAVLDRLHRAASGSGGARPEQTADRA
jgi:L-threonylcarbamoyladenylate synthase